MAIKESTLDALFNPESIAIIGATPDEKRIGGRPLAYLQKNNYKGSIFPINPKYDVITGLKCYGSIAEINQTIDLAIISLPKNLVLDKFKECAENGVRSVVIFSAGFGEVDEEGKQQQEEITSIAKKHNVRVLGPNCLGMFNVNKGVYATFSTILEKQTLIKGKIGFVSQSGAFGSHVYTLARQNHIGLSHFIATGNESDVDVADCIAYLAQDNETEVIACYIEGAKDGEKLINAFKLAAENNKPVVALKVGTTNVGKKAALSHTGSLAGSDDVYDAIFEQYGVYRAETIEEFLDVAYASAELPIPKGDRVAIFTVSGGVGIMLADQLSERHLSVPETPQDVQEKLKEMLPIAGVKNPIDTTAQLNAIPNLLDDFIDTVLGSGKYDSTIVFLAFTGLMPEVLEKRILTLKDISNKYKDIPLITVTLNTEESKKTIIDNGLVLSDDPTRAVNMLKALNFYREHFNRKLDESEKKLKQTISISSQSSVLTEYEGKKLIQQYDIPVTKERLATSPEEAVILAKEVGFPIAMKGMSPEILHKTDEGLVYLNIDNEKDVEQTFQILKNKVDNIQDAQFDGVLIQEMLTDDSVEMFIGSKSDPVFGQVILVGMGGIYIEILKDAAIRKAPVSVEEAERMVNELRGSSLLKGARGKQPYDVKALCNLISNFSQFIANAEDSIQELDLNPIMVFEKGKGVKVADALITLKK
ncbi:CoA-binding protein [Pueribacillus theae]|uniref:CoA-binding protein n=1 Tax=Pueribacillus theae TaxID=2171751 RepID=A0A2U1JS92_9BACI|nr:acetate--CoA ligase family protein [Pueribacillus theae]PWA07829.1 CoA-binding protein [Pueribacillus theae]